MCLTLPALHAAGGGAIEEQFQVVLVQRRAQDEPGGYEPVVADPTRLDLRWLAEEQALLALPLVPLHEPSACEHATRRQCGRAGAANGSSRAEDVREAPRHARERVFKNLRDLLEK